MTTRNIVISMFEEQHSFILYIYFSIVYIIKNIIMYKIVVK
jgi:hypothetical protein